ncbi:MAG: hypothetical protein E6H10_07535 [Bacteroidetes bacterium]|nr:MAG: hypothetical protein E6H10_07535 [Bacteroidota bacterium]
MNLGKDSSAFLSKRDFLSVLFLILIAVAIFYPVFYTEYLYTDESVQLWLYKEGSGFQMFITQGRYITEKLFRVLFSRATTVHDLIYIRLFSFLGWLICIPIWYFIIKKIVTKERLPALLIVSSVVYLICTPPFSICVRWASCLELFIANTAGLLSGYILYASIDVESEKIGKRLVAITGSAVLGLISLFTYQNGFGCFLLPFLLHLVSRPNRLRKIFIGIAISLCIYVLYYVLFKLNLRAHDIEAVERTKISINIFSKIRFFFRPLATAFHFTALFNEKSLIGFIIYVLTFFAWICADFYESRALPLANRVKTLILTIFLLIVIYLPSLIVKENYFSNRTLLALNMAVFFLCANMLLTAIKMGETRTTVIAILSFGFVLNARYNFIQEFLNPVKTEYQKVRASIEKNYNRAITTVYFIRPHEDFFVKKYGITRSWDEFGVPSNFFDWVPEFFTKQVIFEKTRNRKIAENLIVKHWLGHEEYDKAAASVSSNTLVVDVEQILNHE